MRRILSFLLLVTPLFAQIPTPEQYFGFRIGSDNKLVRYDKGIEYLQKIASMSDRVRYRDLGPTTQGHPFALLEISSADNIKNLDHLKSLERQLYFQDGAPTEAQRDEIFRDGKSVLLITNNIHSTEIGSSQMVLELVYQLATDNSPRTKNILDNVVFLLIPSLNPDGQMMVTDWFNKTLGTPYAASPMPWLYHPYVGHDDNRDMYVFSQKESQMTANLIWHDWFPSIWLDEHQQGSAGPRIFTMPATDPINPNVDPLIYRLNTIYGQEQAAALEAEGKIGIIYNATYTNWWQGAMAWSGWWHNEVGLLTEVASARVATPIKQEMADPTKPLPPAPSTPEQFEAERNRLLEHPDEPLPPPRDTHARTEYPHPWMGGTWTLRDIVDYELTATWALLDAAAVSRNTLLHQIYDINLHTVEQGTKGEIGGGKTKNFALLIPVNGQHDANEVIERVDKLRIAGVKVDRAGKDFEQDGHKYAAGTYVVNFDQVFARYAKDIVEKQTYPEVRRAPNAPPEAPYDVSAWSLGMQFGVKTDFAHTPLSKDLNLTELKQTPAFTLAVDKPGADYRFPYTGAESNVVINRLLKDGAKVTISKSKDGVVPYVTTSAKPDAWKKATAGFEVKESPSSANSDAKRGKQAAASDSSGTTLRMPRVGLYQTYLADADEGWTRWVLDHYEFPYTVLHNADLKAGKLRDKFDAIIIPDQREKDILTGLDFKTIMPEYRGGIGDDGWNALHDFLNQGGTLVALGEATTLLIDKLPLPVKDLKRAYTREQAFAPGAVVNLQVDTSDPIGYGVAADTWGYYINSPFFEITPGFSSQKVNIVARYPNANANASGWVRGENLMVGTAAVVSVETNPGKVVLFGIRPQHRAQTHATFPMLFNALYWSVEQPYLYEH
ncbi:MAG TPA: M14 metallopeptidase family protein [Terriglobales bacterium]|nr:M14 metallopeptidase family protein [Terriglobales bacterium]